MKNLILILILCVFLGVAVRANAIYDEYELELLSQYDRGYSGKAKSIVIKDNYLYLAYILQGNENILIITKNDLKGNMIWKAEHPTDITIAYLEIDSMENILVAGNLSGDGKLIKFDKFANQLWSKIFDYGGKYNNVRGIAVDSMNNIIVGGHFNKSGKPYDDDFYAIKYSEFGNEIWRTQYVGISHDQVSSGIIVDYEDNVIEGGMSPYGLHAVKYRGDNGQIIWSKGYHSGNFGKSHGMTLDSTGNVYLTGDYHSHAIDSCGGPTYNARTMKLSSAGEILWINDIDSGCFDVGKDIKIDKNGNVIVLGTYDREDAIFVYSKDGILIDKITNTIGLPNIEFLQLILDESDNFYLGGVYYNNGNWDYVIARFGIKELDDNPFSFAHLTDPHIGSSWLDGWKEELSYPRFTDGLYELMKMSVRPDFVLVSGDVVEYANDRWFRDYQAMADSMTAQAGIGVYTVPGNHDRYNGATGNARCIMGGDCEDGLAAYRGNIRNSDLAQEDYFFADDPFNYSFTHKGVRFVGLDSGGDYMPDYELGDMRDVGPEGNGLLAAQINALSAMATATPKVVFTHHPVFSGGVDACRGDGCARPELEDASFAHFREELLGLASTSNLQLVLAGHTHNDMAFDLDGEEVELPSDKPLFIQTQSAAKDGGVGHGYRLVDVEGGKIRPWEVSETALHKKVVGKLDADENINLRVYDPNDPANYISLTDTDGLSVPFFTAPASGRVIIYEIENNTSKFELVKRTGGDPESKYDFSARLEGEVIPTDSYVSDFGFYLDAPGTLAFLKMKINGRKAEVNFEDMEFLDFDTQRILIDWEEFIAGGEGGISVREISESGDESRMSFLPIDDMMSVSVDGPVEFLVIDSQGRMTGIYNGTVYEEIPYALYDSEDDKVNIYFKDGYDGEEFTFRVKGLDNPWVDDEVYNLDIMLRQGSEETVIFTAEDIPTEGTALHEYVKTGEYDEKGMKLSIDRGDDGVFEQSEYVGKEFSGADYMKFNPGASLSGLLLELKALSAENQDDDKLKKIISLLEKSLSSEYWLDDLHLSRQGRAVFDLHAEAAGDIRVWLLQDSVFNHKGVLKVVKDQFVLEDEVRDAFRETLSVLVSADLQLAKVVLNEAKQADPDELIKFGAWKLVNEFSDKGLDIAELLNEKNPVAVIKICEGVWGKVAKF
jgi:DNA repair exonuclease SbcCD nuclease subunit